MDINTTQNVFSDTAPQPLSEKKKRVVLFLIISSLIFIGAIFLFMSMNKKPLSDSETRIENKTIPLSSNPLPYESKVESNDTELQEEEFQKNDQESFIDRQPPPPPQSVSNQNNFRTQNTQQNYQSVQSSGSSEQTGYRYSSSVASRLSDPYQSMVKHFSAKKPLEIAVLDQSELKTNALARVDASLSNLYEGADKSQGFAYGMGTGSRIIAVTDGTVSSDHPGFFTSTVIRPFELKGAKLLCQSGQNLNGRIPVNPVKLIVDGKETEIAGQVETNFPGLDGKIKNHWVKRVGPAITNAAIGGAFLAWSYNRSSGEDRIDTRDAIAGPIVQSSVEGLQNEVNRFGGDIPNTVTVEMGKEFSILLTSPISLSVK